MSLYYFSDKFYSIEKKNTSIPLKSGLMYLFGYINYCYIHYLMERKINGKGCDHTVHANTGDVLHTCCQIEHMKITEMNWPVTSQLLPISFWEYDATFDILQVPVILQFYVEQL